MRLGFANYTITMILALMLASGPVAPLVKAGQNKNEKDWEEVFRSLPQAERLKKYMQQLSAEPHHIGSAAGKRNAEWMRDQLKSWGFDAKLEEFDVLFPTPKERVLELISPEKHTAKLKEPVLAEDSDSGDENQLPTYNAYSGDGDVTAPLVYVNYGIPADYELVGRMGVDVKGKIVIARYGASWRGIKPKVAFEHGAVGCLIYSDPKEDGYFQGDVYPKGPYRPDFGVQRGSVMDMPVHPGDPLTPGWGATKNARRLSREESKTLMKIPVLPISYGDALPLLKNLGGQVVPETWRGALPITYHVGGNESTKARLKVVSDWKLHTLYNVVARIEGSTYPDEWVIRGNHHDAWVNGADDPVSGMVAVLEEARAFGELLKQGWRPKRTIIFCAWDGEEPGLLGSTEWVEEHAEELKQKAVAYINSDSSSKGTFGVGGSHTLEKFVNDVARSVNDPKGKGSLWEVMKARRGGQSGSQADNQADNRADLRISALGSGSDYTAFIDHLGIASLNVGFGGEGGGGIYHSIYDSFAWYTRFSDTTFEYGRTLVQAAGTATMRLADARILPFEFTNFAETVGGYVDDIARLPKQNVDLTPLRQSVEKLKRNSDNYDRALNALLRTGSVPAETKELNKLLFQSERKLLSDAGLPRREWFKHQVYAPGFYTGYGVKTLPGVREALEQKNWAEAAEQVKVIATTLNVMAAQIEAATLKLKAR